MDAEITPSSVAGRVTAPPSKSYTHRAILAAGYGEGETRVEAPLVSADTRATARAVRAFGGEVDLDDAFVVRGFGDPEVPENVIDCGNSGTTMRLVTATAALADHMTVLTGDGSLRSRPHGPLLDAIDDLGGRAESTRNNGRAPLVVGGPITGERVSIPGDVSSQFVTALLMAGARTERGVTIDLETDLKSAPYVEITREMLADFGVETEHEDGEFAVDGEQSYDPGESYRVPGDFSSISYLLAAGALAADEGLDVDGASPSAQGDTAIVDHLERMGATLSWTATREPSRSSGAISKESRSTSVTRPTCCRRSRPSARPPRARPGL